MTIPYFYLLSLKNIAFTAFISFSAMSYVRLVTVVGVAIIDSISLLGTQHTSDLTGHMKLFAGPDGCMKFIFRSSVVFHLLNRLIKGVLGSALSVPRFPLPPF